MKVYYVQYFYVHNYQDLDLKIFQVSSFQVLIQKYILVYLSYHLNHMVYMFRVLDCYFYIAIFKFLKPYCILILLNLYFRGYYNFLDQVFQSYIYLFFYWSQFSILDISFLFFNIQVDMFLTQVHNELELFYKQLKEVNK